MSSKINRIITCFMFLLFCPLILQVNATGRGATKTKFTEKPSPSGESSEPSRKKIKTYYRLEAILEDPALDTQEFQDWLTSLYPYQHHPFSNGYIERFKRSGIQSEVIIRAASHNDDLEQRLINILRFTQKLAPGIRPERTILLEDTLHLRAAPSLDGSMLAFSYGKDPTSSEVASKGTGILYLTPFKKTPLRHALLKLPAPEDLKYQEPLRIEISDNKEWLVVWYAGNKLESRETADRESEIVIFNINNHEEYLLSDCMRVNSFLEITVNSFPTSRALINSSNNRLVLAGYDAETRVYNLDNLSHYDSLQEAHSAALSPCGNYLFLGHSDGRLEAIELLTGNVIAEIKDSRCIIDRIIVAPKGQPWLITVTKDPEGDNGISIWDYKSGDNILFHGYVPLNG